jgi:hypothetical protein
VTSTTPLTPASGQPWASPDVPHVTLTPLSSTEWRVSDPRESGDDADCVLGFIQNDDHGYEVTMLRPLNGVHRVTTLREAIELFASSSR